jgi:hypothetical protein
LIGSYYNILVQLLEMSLNVTSGSDDDDESDEDPTFEIDLPFNGEDRKLALGPKLTEAREEREAIMKREPNRTKVDEMLAWSTLKRGRQGASTSASSSSSTSALS